MQPGEVVTGSEIARPQVETSVRGTAAHFLVVAAVRVRPAPAVRAGLPAWERVEAVVAFVGVADVEGAGEDSCQSAEAGC